MNMEGSHFKVKSFCEKRQDNSKNALNLKKMQICTTYEQFSFRYLLS